MIAAALSLLVVGVGGARAAPEPAMRLRRTMYPNTATCDSEASRRQPYYLEFDLGTVRSGPDAPPLPMQPSVGSAEPCTYTTFAGERIYYFWTCPDYVPTVYHCAKEGCLECGDAPYAVFNNTECVTAMPSGIVIPGDVAPNSLAYECLAGPPTPRPTFDLSGLIPSPPTAADASSAAACSSSVPASFYAGLVLLTAAAAAGVYM